MKKKLLLLAAMLPVLSVSAQEWEEPELPTEASEVVSGHKYRVRNVAAYTENTEGESYLAGATTWFGWSTSTALVLPENAITFTLTETESGWTFAREDGKFTFISGASPQGIENSCEMHVDQGNQDANLKYFSLMKSQLGYRIYAAPINPAFNVPIYNEEGVPQLFWGWMPNNYEGEVNSYPYAVYGSVSPEEGWACDWEFVDCTTYPIRMSLYELQYDAAEYDIDLTNATAIYNNPEATLEELTALYNSLKEAIAIAKANAFLEGASEDDPVDATELIENPDFSTGNISGWVCTFQGGVNATNIGYQSASYTGKEWYDEETGEDGTAFLNQFIEAWAANNNNMKRDGKTFATIGDAKLYQTIYGLPAGKYKLSADVNAVQQYDGSQNPVTGVQLYATAGELEATMDMATDNGVPEHFILTFIHTGGDVELGLRTQATTANWIAADNFKLVYYGPINKDPEQVLLEDYIASLEKKYPEVGEIKALTTVKEAYEKTLEEAQNATANFKEVKLTLEAAAKALEASIAEYKVAKAAIDDLEAKIDQINEEQSEWADLTDALSTLKDDIEGKYDDGVLTSEEIQTIETRKATLIAEFISENCKKGDDITILLNNPAFDTNFSGWSTTGATPAWGGVTTQGANDLGSMADVNDEAQSTWGGCAEVYHNTFSMFQVVKNLPAGLYKFICQGFDRCDDGSTHDTAAELYADVMALSDSSVVSYAAKLTDQGDCASDEQLYNSNNEWFSDQAYGEKWVPNGMAGAMYHFHHKGIDPETGEENDEYDYTSKLNIVLTQTSDITVGVRISNGSHWVIFDDFKIIYMGSGADVYGEPIDALIKEGEAAITAAATYQEESIQGTDAQTSENWENAKTAANKALEDGDEEGCIKALEALKTGIDAIKASASAIQALYDKWYFAQNYRIVSLDTDYEAITALLDDELPSKFMDEGFASLDEVAEYTAKIDMEFTNAVLASADLQNASEAEPADVSGVIFNANYTLYDTEAGSLAGWTNASAAGVYGMTNAEGNTIYAGEFWNKNFSTTQELRGLPAGNYRLKVQGFYRPGDWGIAPTLEAEANPEVNTGNVTLFAGEAKTTFLSISDELTAIEENMIACETLDVNGTTYYAPVSMQQACACFEAGLYQNVLQFEVTPEAAVKSQLGGSVADAIVIGLKKETLINADWTMFADWKLEYIGTAEPSEDATTVPTAIENVNTSAVVAAKYYNVNGAIQNGLKKGVNIVKAVKADGTVQMVKILVK